MARGRVPPGTWGPWRSLPVLAILLLVGLLASRPAGAWLRTIGDRFVSEPPTVVPEVHLVRSARPLSPIEPGPFLGTYVAGRSAQLIRPLINRQANVFSQWDPQSSPLSLDRVGVHFSPTPQSTLGSSMPFGPRDYPMEPVPSLSGQPALMGIQPDSLVLVLGSGEYTHQVGTFSVLAASAIDENLVELLIRRDDIGDIMFAWLQSNDLHLSLVHPPAQMDLAGIRAAAGLGGNFHMWHGEYYGRVLLTPVSAPATGLADSPGRPEAQTLQQAIVSATSTSAWPGLAGSRFLDVRPTRLVPGNVEDTVALLDSGMVVICRGGHLADCASPLVIGLPGQLSASARLMVPSPKDLAGQAIAWLQVYDPPPSGQAPVIWHAVLVPGRGDFIRWLKLVLPPGAGSAEPSLRPIRLASSDPTSSNWVLASKWIFLDPVAFRCDTDRSIICSTPGNVLSNADGWKCAPGRELSFLAGQEELCAGCAAGWMLTQAPSGQRTPLSPWARHLARSGVLFSCPPARLSGRVPGFRLS